jgi:hypothetical protein
MSRLEAAGLAAIAFHEPQRLADERRTAIADAAPIGEEARIVARARKMVEDIQAGAVLSDDVVSGLTLLS